jgi:hypothetical protein
MMVPWTALLLGAVLLSVAADPTTLYDASDNYPGCGREKGNRKRIKGGVELKVSILSYKSAFL